MEKREEPLNIVCFITQNEIVCSAYSDNPHGPNNEVRCSWHDFLSQKTHEAKTSRYFIKEQFGDSAVEKIVKCISKTNG